MRPPAGVVAAAEVGELPTGGGRHDQLAGVRVRQRRPGPLASLRMVEDRGVAIRAGRSESKLSTVTARDGLVRLAPEDDIDGLVAVEPPGERRRIVVGVHHARTVRGRHAVFGEDVLQPGDVGHGRLAVVGTENDRVPLEELVGPTGGLDQRADGHRRTGRARRALHRVPGRARRSRSPRGR